jgi:hypothetical protein
VSGSTIGGVVGAVVGFYFGGPQGAQYGWMIGSAVGGYVDPTLIKAPRLADLRSQTSAVGGAIPRAWGTAPVPGNVLWQGPVVTHTTVEDGKGSGTEQEVKTRTRSYAIMFHLGEIAGVLQIKRNGKIVYDARDDDTLLAEYEASLGPLETVDGYFNRLRAQRAVNSRWINKCRIYTGTQTQEPDPTIESYLGVGNVPAYRGRAYMVVTDDETQAGEIAQYEIIVAVCGTVTTTTASIDQWVAFESGHPGLRSSADGTDWDTPSEYIEATGYGAAVADPTLQNRVYRDGGEVLVVGCSMDGGGPGVILSSDGFITTQGWSWGGSLRSPTAARCAGTWFFGDGIDGIYRYSGGGAWTLIPVAVGSNHCLGSDGTRLYRFAGDTFYRIDTSDASALETYPVSFGRVAMAGNGGGTCVALLHRYAHDLSSIIYELDTGTLSTHTSPFPTGLTSSDPGGIGMHYSPDFAMWVAVLENRLAYGAGPDSLTLSSYVFPNTIVGVDDDGEKFIVACAGGTLHSSEDLETFTTVFSTATATNAMTIPVGIVSIRAQGTPIPDAPGFYVDENGTIIGGETTTITPCSTTTDGEIVAAVCELSGLTADEYDTSQLTTTLDGYVIARETDAASVIESLRPVGMFDPAEWDGKLRFIKRGGTAVGSINGDDLVERDGDAVEREMVQEVELLRKVSVGYLDTQAAWAPNTQAWERTVGTINARGESVVEVTAVMGADQAATVAKRKGLSAWGEPEKQKLSLLSLRHAKYTPTDILNYTDADAEVHTIRLMQIEDDSGIREIESSLNCAEAYNATATGVAPKPPTITDESLRGPTYAVYMNLPSLRTQDNVPGVTIAACGLLSGWSGAAIMLSVDGGVSYQQLTTFTQPTTMGRLTDVCTDSSEPISVSMNQGSLSSITDAQLAQRHNAYAILTDDVAELGQFKTATATSATSFQLTDNVRGQLGTQATSHAVGDPFVLVAAAQFVPLDISLAGRTLYFKAVTFGTSQDAAEAVPFVFNPLFTSVTVAPLTTGGEAITLAGQPIYVVTTNA